MSTFTAVDLSRLLAPDVVEQLDYEAIFGAMLAHMRGLHPAFTVITEADPVYALLQVCAYRELLLRQRSNDACRAVMLAYAGGADLDNLGALMGVARQLLDPGDPAQSIPPVYESDTEFRRRIQLAPEGFSVAGPDGAYVFHALGADPDVLDASVHSPEPGEVVVTVLSRTGTGAASPALVETVAQVLADGNVRPLTDQVTVQPATVQTYQVEAILYTYAGPDSALVLAEAQRRTEATVRELHRLGRDVALSGLYAALHTEGVQRVELLAPLADMVLDHTQAAYCTGITIVHGGVDE